LATINRTYPTHADMFEDFFHFVFGDLWISLPMFFASLLTVAVIFERALFFNRNQKDIEQLTQRLQRDLEQGNYSQAQYTASLAGGVIGSVAEGGIRLLSRRTSDFSTAFDICINLGLRKLEKNLAALGTVGAITPFLGLLGTVVGILRSFQVYANAGAPANALAKEIGFALIATAAGLVIAIIAVVAYNVFSNQVSHFEDDMQQLKLLFLGFVNPENTAPGSEPFNAPVAAAESTPFPKNLL